MTPIQVAESSTPKRQAQPKALDHVEIHPKLDGGHIVRHVYHGFGHEPKDVHFNKDGKAKGGEHIAQHLAKHANLPGLLNYDKRDESETEEELEA